MYDALTSALLFLILTPGILPFMIPPTGGIVTAVVHAVIFYVVQSYLSSMIPAWGIWVLAIAIVGLKIWGSRPPTA